MKLISDLHTFYISYDEPEADATYAWLQAMAPCKVDRVHGVKGFHAAHERCAELSKTSRFVTIDGDNQVFREVFNQHLEDADRDIVYSFNARNVINGLIYGNGGVKVWPRGLLRHVPTHENAEIEIARTDFCFTYRYMQVNFLGSEVRCNGSPQQAFRAGYREAVKLTYVEGQKLDTWRETLPRIYHKNLSRLNIWANVGLDVRNGDWAIYGARQGLADIWLHGIDPAVITDYEFFAGEVASCVDWSDPNSEIDRLGRLLTSQLGIDFVRLDPAQSRWFKSVYLNPERHGLMLPNLKPVDFPDV